MDYNGRKFKTCMGCGDWLWSPDIVLQAQNQLHIPDMCNTSTHIQHINSMKQLVQGMTGLVNSKCMETIKNWVFTHQVCLPTKSHEKIIRFYIPMEEPFRMHILYSGHLHPNKKHVNTFINAHFSRLAS